MFFTLSKVLWWFAAPGNALLAVIGLGVLLLWTPWRRAGRRLATLGVLLLGTAAMLPIGGQLIQTLENRFPVVHRLPEHVDGIIALGGVADQFVTVARGQVAIGDPVERLTEMAALARRHPEARLIFTGGSGLLFDQSVREADVLAPFFSQIGLDPARITFEDQARNTYENAQLVSDLAAPKPGETWVLITSAFHMPRAVGCFRKIGWDVLPYPVDFKTTGKAGWHVGFNVSGNLGALDLGVHEWLGLLFYRITGRTDALFPAPEGAGA